MVTEISRSGLIVTQAMRTNVLLDEFIALCDWPVVTQPSARLLFQQIDICRPLCLVFWLDSENDVDPVARLVARLRERGPRPYRIAVAHHLTDDVEHVFRSAGVHSYLSTNGSIRALVDDALLPLIDVERVKAHAQRALLTSPAVPIRSPTDVRGSPASLRPP